MQLLRKKGLLDSPRVLFLPVDASHPIPISPAVFGTQELEELAGSIQALGLLQPLTVRRRADGWELVAGERRLRAAKLAGLEEVPCISLQIDTHRSAMGINSSPCAVSSICLYPFFLVMSFTSSSSSRDFSLWLTVG